MVWVRSGMERGAGELGRWRASGAWAHRVLNGGSLPQNDVVLCAVQEHAL